MAMLNNQMVNPKLDPGSVSITSGAGLPIAKLRVAMARNAQAMASDRKQIRNW